MELYYKNNQSSKSNAVDLRIESSDVHIWQMQHDVFVKEKHKFSALLSDEEYKKAKSFQFEEDKTRYIICHGFLRILLAGYLKIKPDILKFCYGKFGKPYINNVGAENINFNISYSNNLLLVVISCENKVGIDVEYMREINEMDQIVEAFFTDNEKMFFREVPEDEKISIFFRLWTRKEAFLKGLGTGILKPLDEIEVVSSGKTKFVLGLGTEIIKIGSWYIKDLKVKKGYSAALALECDPDSIQLKFFTSISEYSTCH